jgi:hypothetical protein
MVTASTRNKGAQSVKKNSKRKVRRHFRNERKGRSLIKDENADVLADSHNICNR